MCIRNKYLISVFLLCLLASCATQRQRPKEAGLPPKREFRGAWIQTVFQSEYKDMPPSAMKKDFIRKLDFLRDCGINAIIFQVRPEADAFYKSNLEPWSRFLTGKQGTAPEGDFDPMDFLIKECHKRNMEFHAWLNPYRAATANFTGFAPSHIFNKYPGRFVRYNKQILFDPGQPQNRRFICQVVHDIVSRYDVDAIHMDDYFYPYPAAGEQFPDDRSFERYGKREGYTEATRGDWRRENVNKLVKEIKQTILKTKPWVRFGISPFGIYRNKKSTPDGSGSETNGLQNYDDLYADVLLWVDKGWIDYNMPQIYWETGHPSADYTTLARWWDKHSAKGHLYIGQDVARTMKAGQLTEKMALERQLPNTGGNCFWPANELLWNTKGAADSLAQHYHRYPALIPAYTEMDHHTPAAVQDLKLSAGSEGPHLVWKSDENPSDPETAQYYVVYRFGKKDKINLEDPQHIVGITRNTSCRLHYNNGKEKFRYVVTAVDRFHNESKGKRIKVKL